MGWKIKKKLRNLFFDAEFQILVIQSGEMSNFLLEDYDAVLNLMNAETQKKKFKI